MASCHAQPNSEAEFEGRKLRNIDKLLNTYHDYGKFSGSVLIAQKGEVLYQKGFGSANLEWGIENKPNTKFRLASVSKQFTAMLIVQLVAENELSLESTVSSIFPNYPKENGSIITIHHLLTHSSGIPNFTSFSNYREMMNERHSPMDLVSSFADSSLNFTPGEKFEYSNSGYVLLGAIIEKLTGKSYEQVMKEQIFEPLNMIHSGYDNNQDILKNRASGYIKTGNNFYHSNYIDMSVPFAAGALYSTVEDLFLWDQSFYTQKLLPKKYLDLIFQKHMSDGNGHYAYGWGIDNMYVGGIDERKMAQSHGGGIDGFRTRITRIPSDSTVVIILSNYTNSHIGALNTGLHAILFDNPYDLPKKSLAEHLANVISEKGIDQALLVYAQLKDSTVFELNEEEMNYTGYEFLQAGNMKEAIAVFKINTEAFPNAFNTYDSYGEALLANGEKELAIENYKMSVKLNPNNTGGINVLKSLGVDTDDLSHKLSTSQLKLLPGKYLTQEKSRNSNGEWFITIEEENGSLFGIDGEYRYKLNAISESKFVNPDDGVILEFDTSKAEAISFVIFGRTTFKKVD